MRKCGNCEHARQWGNKKSQDIVGCVLLNKEGSYETVITEHDSIVRQSEYITPLDVKNSNIYEGYIYFGRRVGDVEESDGLGKGAFSYGRLVDAKGYCSKFKALD